MAVCDGATVFVFGSNLRGRHGAGAARHAATNWGAQEGVGVGPTGRSYALPTKDRKIKTLSTTAIRMFVGDFIDYAKAHPELTFVVTQIGCGLAGYTPQIIAPMFRDAPKNCQFDVNWRPILGEGFGYWGHVG
mgnify:FL=1